MNFIGHYRVPESVPRRVRPGPQEEGETVRVPSDVRMEESMAGSTETNRNENKWPYVALIVVIVLLSGFVLFLVGRRFGHVAAVGQFSNSSSTSSAKREPVFYSSAIELESGYVQVGKILFNPLEILGKGCEGTFVYKGKSRNS